MPAPGFPEVAIKRPALDGARFPLEPDRVLVMRANANAANGMAVDLEGRLVVCEQGSPVQPAAISRLVEPSLADERQRSRTLGVVDQV